MRFLLRVAKFIRGNLLLTVILAVGFVLRILSTNPGYLSHGDELMYGQALQMFLNKTLGINPLWMGYPPLVAWIMLFFFTFIFIPGAWILYFITHFQDVVSLFGGIYQTSGSTVFNLHNIFHFEILRIDWKNVLYWGRYTTALFGAGAVYFVYLTGLNLFNKKVGLISAALVAVNYRLVLSSSIGFVDMYNIFFLFVSFWAVSLLMKKPNLKNYVFSWISVALSFLTKYQIYVFFPLMVAHLYLSIKDSGSVGGFIKKFVGRGVVLGGLVALIIVAISHFHYINHIEQIISIHRYEVVKYGFGVNNFYLFPISYLYHSGIGPFLSLIAIAGILFGLTIKKFRLPSLIMLSPVPLIGFLYFYYTGGGFFTRNVIVLIPIFLIFSAVLISIILDFALKQKPLISKLLGFLILFLVTFFSFKDHLVNSSLMAYMYSGPSQESLAQKWIENNIKGKVVFGTDNARLIPSDKNVKPLGLPHPYTSFSYRELLTDKYDYVAVDTSFVQSYLYWWMKQPLNIELKFWNRPDDLLAQNYLNLALRELMWEHGQKAFLTTWQAPGYNYAVFKVDRDGLCNQSSLVEKASLGSFNWTPLYLLVEYENYLYKNELQQPVIKNARTLPGASRWQSSALEIKPNYCYKATGTISIKNALPKTGRDGFLRMDFYKVNPKAFLTSRPIVTFVSERIYGDAGSHVIDIQAIAPDEARYVTIGFQADGATTDFTLLDLKFSESSSSVVKSEPQHLILKDENILQYNNGGII